MRWLFARAETVAPLQKLAVQAGTLYVFEDGARVLAPSAGVPISAPQRLPKLAGVLQREKELAFLDGDGNVHLTAGALDAPSLVREAPRDHAVTQADAGKAAILLVTGEGRCLRSTDLGESWQRTAEQLPGVVRQVLLDDRGRGLLRTVPQGLWRTVDDGATWQRQASTGTGVRGLGISAGGQLAVLADTPQARHEKWTLLVDGSWQTDVQFAAPKAPELARVVAQDLSGNVVVRALLPASKTEEVRVAVHAVDESPSWVPVSGLVGCDDLEVAAGGGSLTLACHRRTDSERVRELWRREKGRWKRDVDIIHRGGPLLVGEDGWLLAYVEVRLASKAELVPLAGALSVPYHVMVHEGRLHVVGRELDDGKSYYSSGPLDGAKLERVELEGDLDVGATLAVRDGRVVVFGRDRGRWVRFDVAARDGAQKSRPAHTIVPERAARVLWYGERGLALRDETGWETSDGGKTWSELAERLPHNPNNPWAANDHCSEHGCRLGRHLRIGWQNVAPTPPPVRSTAKRAPKPELGLAELMASGGGAELACRRSESSTPIGRVPDIGLLLPSLEVGSVRWAIPITNQKTRSIVIERPKTNQREEIDLVAESTRPDVVVRTRLSPYGLAAARETGAGSGGRASRLGVELVSLDWRGRKTTGRIADAGSFDTWGSPAAYDPLLEVASDGRLYYRPGPSGADQVYTLAPGARVGTTTLPASAKRARSPVRIAGTLAGLEQTGSAAVLSTAQGVWHWTVGRSQNHGTWGSGPALGVTVLLGEDHARTRAFVVPLVAAADPPAIIEVERSALGTRFDKACEAGAAGGVALWLYNEAEVRVEGVAEPLLADVIVRAREGLAPCVVGFVSKLWMDEFVFVPADDFRAARLFEMKRDAENRSAGTLAVTPLTCAVDK